MYLNRRNNERNVPKFSKRHTFIDLRSSSNSNRNMPRPIIIAWPKTKDKEKFLKAASENDIWQNRDLIDFRFF